MKIYGPYLRPDGRKHVILVEGRSKTTISYPKFLLMELGIQFGPYDEVHHRDGDFTNNTVTNLVKISKFTHASSHKLGTAKYMTVTCESCGGEFELLVRQHKGNQLRQGRAGPYCSKSCAGKVHH